MNLNRKNRRILKASPGCTRLQGILSTWRIFQDVSRQDSGRSAWQLPRCPSLPGKNDSRCAQSVAGYCWTHYQQRGWRLSRCNLSRSMSWTVVLPHMGNWRCLKTKKPSASRPKTKVDSAWMAIDELNGCAWKKVYMYKYVYIYIYISGQRLRKSKSDNMFFKNIQLVWSRTATDHLLRKFTYSKFEPQLVLKWTKPPFAQLTCFHLPTTAGP